MSDQRNESNAAKYLVTLIAGAFALAHVFEPKLGVNIKIDEITLALVFLATLPWLIPVLRSNVKRGKFFGQEVEFLEQKVGEQEKRISQTETQVLEAQEKINAVVTYSLAFYLFKHLSKLYHEREYHFNKDPNFERELRFLRDLGYLEFFRIGELRDGENLVGKLKLTPLGKILVELREGKRALKLGSPAFNKGVHPTCNSATLKPDLAGG